MEQKSTKLDGKKMTQKTFCDVCNAETYGDSADVCHGYKKSSECGGVTEKFKPFEKPKVSKTDLCAKHYKLWCEATYNCFWKNKGEKNE
jgi:hypothetical protein